eukprot:gene10089-12375_t
MPDRDDVDKLVIGNFCSIGSGVSFLMAGNQGHRRDWVSTFPFFYMSEVEEFNGATNAYIPSGDTVIGNDVWIGTEAMFMPGVTVGARSLVTKNVEPYTIVGGNPAAPIKKRFSESQIK